jgi:hypothetical protein
LILRFLGPVCYEIQRKNMHTISFSTGNTNQEKFKLVPFIGYGNNSYKQIVPLSKVMLLLGYEKKTEAPTFLYG